MVQIPTWLIFAGFVLILFIALAVYFQFFYNSKFDPPPVGSDSLYQPTVSWGKITPVPGELCYGYQFPVSQETFFLRLGTPTLNSQVLDNYSTYGITREDEFSCLDSDRLNAIKVQHTCDEVPPGRDPQTLESSCYNLQGDLVPYGSTEIFYQTCRSGSISSTALYCPGQVSGVSVAYQAFSQNDIPCLVWNLDPNAGDPSDPDFVGGTISATDPRECNLGDPNQQFRVIRTRPGIYPSVSTKQGDQGNNGFLAAIVERESGLCLMPPTNTPNDGDPVVLRNCADNNFGYVWALIPPIVYDKTLGSSAQQITYVGEGTVQEFNQLSVHNPTDLYNYLVSINAKSMKNDGGKLTLQPYTQDGFPVYTTPPSTNQDVEFNSQYASFALYNVIANQDTFTPF